MERHRSDMDGAGHPRFHSAGLVLQKGPMITVKVKTSKKQEESGIGFIFVQPCESHSVCTRSYVKLRGLNQGQVQSFESMLWRDLDGNPEEPPLAFLGGVQLTFEDPRCLDKK